jgi:hypothetical protein
MMNQLQAVALNEGLRCKKKLWREGGREQLESFRLAPWASQRRHDLLELLDRMNPTIAKLTQAIALLSYALKSVVTEVEQREGVSLESVAALVGEQY